MYHPVKRKDIDTEAWDRCVRSAENANLFGTTRFLDIATDRWRGLVRGDYEAVFPVIESTKFGLPYVYRPPGLARVGIFGERISPAEEWREILKFLKGRYAYVDMLIDEVLPPDYAIRGVEFGPRQSQYLDTSELNFDGVWKNYRSSGRNVTRNARNRGLVVEQSRSVDDFMSIAKHSMAAKKIPRFDRQLGAMERLARELLKSGMGELWLARDAQSIHSMALVSVFDHVMYLHFILGNEQSLKSHANYLLITEMLRHHLPALKGFDFCGSDISSIGHFNRKFGAEDRSHTQVRLGPASRFVKG